MMRGVEGAPPNVRKSTSTRDSEESILRNWMSGSRAAAAAVLALGLSSALVTIGYAQTASPTPTATTTATTTATATVTTTSTATATSTATTTATATVTATATPISAPVMSVSGTVPTSGSIGLLVLVGGGTPQSIVSLLATSGCTVDTLGTIVSGSWLMYVNGAPQIVNAQFPLTLADRVGFFVRCR